MENSDGVAAMSLGVRAVVLLASPLKLLDVRCRAIERMLDLRLAAADVRNIRSASGSTRLGAYYHWYLQKLMVARAIRGVDEKRARAFIASLDRTDYSRARPLLEGDAGVLVAIPHHAHYILSMTALAAHVGRHRKVKVFYASPATNAGNAVFDHLHDLLFSSPASGVEVIHNTRQGLAKAMKSLRDGEVVFIMPDAYTDVSATMMLPFCGRLANAMLGTAALARKTGSWILPVVSRKAAHGLSFRSEFGQPVHCPEWQLALSVEQEQAIDYGVMRRVFRQFEGVMADELILWQNLRQHLGSTLEASRLLEPGQIAGALDELRGSPWFRRPDLVLDLRSAPAAD